MATRTQATAAAPTKVHGVASRAYDHIYDVTCTMSDPRDLQRAQASIPPQQLVPVPDAVNMFSVLAHHPHGSLRVEHGPGLPPTVPQGFQQRRAMQQAEASAAYASVDAQGRDRYKYRTNAAALQQPGSPDRGSRSAYTFVKYAAPPAASETQRPPQSEPRTRTVFIQTDYRENDTQTDPWTPEYVVRPGSAPEVLTLVNLSYGHGLPAGLAEVEMIERAREKRKWQASLPPITDEHSADMQLRAMEEQEMREWQVREDDIEKLQRERLALLTELLHQRNESKKMELDNKLDKLYQEQQASKVGRVDALHATALRTVRSLSKQRNNIEGTFVRRDLIDDYDNPGSSVYAPKAREGGSVVEKQGNQFVVESHLLKTYHGLLELEASLPQGVTMPRIVQPPVRSRPQGKTQREAARLQASLRQIDQTLKLSKTATVVPEPPPRFQETIIKPAVRPPTPTIDAEAEEELEIITIQRFLRGRAVQNGMFDGKARRQELVDELRSTHALREDQKAVTEASNLALARARSEQQLEQRMDGEGRGAVADMQGRNVGAMLDVLSKELVRLQEERRIHAFAMMAERQRRMREAEESGRRQIEQTRRAQQDEVFRQVVQVHHATVDSYLEDLILGASAASADEQARVEIRKKADAINSVAQEMYDTGYDRGELGAQAIAAELVSSFLLPEVKKQAMRENVERSQRRFLQAAHKEIYTAANASGSHAQAETRPLDEFAEERAE